MIQEIREHVDRYIEKLIAKDENYIRCSFFDVRMNEKVSEQELNDFLRECKKKLENKGYSVFFTGARFNYMGAARVVETNEYLIGIKDDENEFNK